MPYAEERSMRWIAADDVLRCTDDDRVWRRRGTENRVKVCFQPTTDVFNDDWLCGYVARVENDLFCTRAETGFFFLSRWDKVDNESPRVSYAADTFGNPRTRSVIMPGSLGTVLNIVAKRTHKIIDIVNIVIVIVIIIPGRHFEKYNLIHLVVYARVRDPICVPAVCFPRTWYVIISIIIIHVSRLHAPNS